MPGAFWQATGLLILSNVFMTFAWYAHLKEMNHRPCYLPQLKILQEVITLLVFVPFVLLYMKQGLKFDYLWAALCILGAVYFVFRDS
jgi:uncharacterized protein (DUF486 family)